MDHRVHEAATDQDQARSPTEIAIGISLITDEVFKNLEIPDLMACREVNKQLDTAAKEFLQKHRKYWAKIKKDPCKSIIQLHKMLENSLASPYNGLSVSIKCSCNCGKSSGPLDCQELISKLISKLSVHSLEIYWPEETQCISSALIRQMFTQHSNCLEQLYIKEFPATIRCPIKDFGFNLQDGDFWLENLKTLQISPKLAGRTDILQDILASAPNLQEFHAGTVSTENVGVVFRNNKFPLIKSFDFSAWTEDFPRFVQLQPELHQLTIAGLNLIPQYGYPGRLETFRALWSSSDMSLAELEMHQEDLLVLSTHEFPPLPELSKISINFLKRTDLGRQFLSGIDFGRLFPNLSTVIIHKQFDEWQTPILQMFSRNSQRPQFVCQTVTQLEVVTSYLLDDDSIFPHVGGEILPSLSNIFPGVKTLTIRGMQNLSIFGKQQWPQWENLESLKISAVWKMMTRAESNMIGIYEEEFIRMQGISKRNRNYILQQHIVPINYSLQNLSKLRNFRIEFSQQPGSCDLTNQPMLTELVGPLVFSKMSDLSVEIARQPCKECSRRVKYRPCPFALDNLRPYVKFVKAETRGKNHPRAHLYS